MHIHSEYHRRDFFDALDQMERELDVDTRRMLASPENADRVRASLHNKLRVDPLIKRLFERMNASGKGFGSPPITEPWMALAEQRMWAAAIAGTSSRIVIDHGPFDSDLDTIRRVKLVSGLVLSQTFLWSKTVFETVVACPLPQHVVSRDILPFPFTFHSFAVGYHVEIPRGVPDELSNASSLGLLKDPVADWILVGDIPNLRACNVSLGIADFVHSDDIADSDRPDLVISNSSIEYGKTFPDEFPEYARASTHLILSMFAFLKSPFVNVEMRPLPRQWRRHGGITPTDNDKLVAVVQLRQAARDAIDAYNAEPAAWKHKWWVRGHYRKQWHASTKSHELIWIAPFLKGPADAPMLQKVYAVNR